MYINNGYLNNSLVDFKEKKKPLVVGCCGTYKMISRHSLTTYRPRGRVDYQIIYVAKGKAHFYFDKRNEEKDTIVHSGNIVIFRPKDYMKYIYYGEDKTEVYWVHFTGKEVKNLLRKFGIADDYRILNIGTSLEYTRIFKNMILELQTCNFEYEHMLTLQLSQLLILISRNLKLETNKGGREIDSSIEYAVKFFTQNYNKELSIEDYATEHGYSISWFMYIPTRQSTLHGVLVHDFRRYSARFPVISACGLFRYRYSGFC